MSTQITIAVQIDGRTRGTVSLPEEAAQNEADVMSAVRRWANGLPLLPDPIGRVVFVPGRLIGLFSEGYDPNAKREGWEPVYGGNAIRDADVLSFKNFGPAPVVKYQSSWTRPAERGKGHHIESITEDGKSTVYVDGVLQESDP